MIRAVVFDLDDTLYPESDFVLSGFRAAAEWLAGAHETRGFFEQLEALFESGERGKLFDRALSAIGILPDPLLVQQLVQTYRLHTPKLRLHPDADCAMNALRSNKVLGLLTDGYLQTQKNKVAALQIQPQFDAVIYSDEFGRAHWKPSPVPYLKAAEALGCAGTECVYIADNLTKDFVTAKQLGWNTVRIARPGGEYFHVQADAAHQAHRTIETLHDLCAALASLEVRE